MRVARIAERHPGLRSKPIAGAPKREAAIRENKAHILSFCRVRFARLVQGKRRRAANNRHQGCGFLLPSISTKFKRTHYRRFLFIFAAFAVARRIFNGLYAAYFPDRVRSRFSTSCAKAQSLRLRRVVLVVVGIDGLTVFQLANFLNVPFTRSSENMLKTPKVLHRA